MGVALRVVCRKLAAFSGRKAECRRRQAASRAVTLIRRFGSARRSIFAC
jgi:hypothetical protein